MKYAVLKVLVVSCALLAAGTSFAQIRVSRARSLAVIIGIDKYKHLSVHSQLQGNAWIARQIRDVLVKIYGFKPGDVKLLVDVQATSREIKHSLGLLESNSISSYENVFIFFAGNFITSKTRGGFLLPNDAWTDPGDVSADPERDESCISMADVWSTLGKCPARDDFLVIDGRGINLNDLAPLGKIEQLLSAGPAGAAKRLNSNGESAFAAEFLRALSDPGSFDAPLSAFHLYETLGLAKDKQGNQILHPQFASSAGESTFAFYSDQALKHSADDPVDIDKVVLDTVELNSISIRDALRQLFRSVSISYVVGSEVAGNVSVSMANVSFGHALRTVLDQVRCTYRIEGGVYEIISR